VPYSEIKENGYDLSISKYREIEYDEVEYTKSYNYPKTPFRK
jgi:type I restriction enzyme M protein